MKTRLALIVIAVSTIFSTTNSLAQSHVAAWGNNSSQQNLLPNGLTNVKQIAAGASHSLALKSDGTVIGWGYNTSGVTSPPVGLSNVLAIAAGSQHNLALLAGGKVVAWGSNTYGRTNVPLSLSNVVQISAGLKHSLALRADGTVVGWGGGNSGEGNVPAGLSNVKAIVAGGDASLALKRDGTVVAWGSTTNGGVPVGLANVVAIASGSYQNLALKADGTVVAWGRGYAGQTNPPSGLSNILSIAAGGSQSLALKADGTLLAWGLNSNGVTNIPVGLSNVTAIAAGGSHNLAIVENGPPEIWTQPSSIRVAYQSNFVLSVTAAGFEPLGYQWLFNGYNISDSAGISGSRTASLAISNAQFEYAGNYRVVVTNALGVVQSEEAIVAVISPPIFIQHPPNRTVLAGSNTTMFVAAMGTPTIRYQWRFNGEAIPGQTSTWLNLTNIQATMAGNYSVMASNAYGVTFSSNAVLSVTDTAPYISAQPTNRSVLIGGSAAFSVSARGSEPLTYQWQRDGMAISGATNSALALTDVQFADEGFYTVVVSNSVGVTVSAKAFLAVSKVTIWGTEVLSALSNFPPGLSNVVAVAAGESHIVTLKADGTVLAWGSRRTNFSSGEWNDGSVYTNTSATNVPPDLHSVVAISAGDFHNLALKADGTVVAWGDNASGQTDIPPGLSNVIAIAAGGNNSLALKADDSIVAWGGISTIPGRIPSTTLTNVPPGLSNLTAIAAGEAHGMALKNDGRIITWGAGTNSLSSFSNFMAVAFGKGTSSYRPSFPDFPSRDADEYLGLRADGTVVLWAARATPGTASVVSGVSNVVAISQGALSIMALRADGTVYVSSATHQPPVGMSNITAIAAGGRGGPFSKIDARNGFYVAIAGDGSPTFALQPVSQRANKGGQIQLHARAVGVQPMQYQWQLNGTNISSATNATLTLTNVQPKNLGEYRVVASNALGVATSADATLSIPPPTLPLALNAPSLEWSISSSEGNAAWFAQLNETHDGEAAAQSGRISHTHFSQLKTIVNGPGTLHFWWKTSSEHGYDFLHFVIGETNVAQASLSGETDWQQRTVSVPDGPQVLKWIYSKDTTVSAGADAGWLDQVSFRPDPVPVEPQIFSPQILADGSFSVSVASVEGQPASFGDLEELELQATTNLVDWWSLTNGECSMILTNGCLQFRDASNSNSPVRFYRFMRPAN